MDQLETIEGIGEVVRTTDEGMGVVFVRLNAYSHDLITKLMAKPE